MKKCILLLLVALAVGLCACQQAPPTADEPSSGAPQLIGLSYDQVSTDPAYADYTLQKAEQFSDTVAAGLISDQSPRPGQAMRDNVIRIVVSKGPRYPSTTAAPVLNRRLPKVTDEYLDAAVDDLQNKGFSVNLDEVVYVNSDKYYRGVVVAQEPAAGSYATTDTPVKLTVSSGFMDAVIQVSFPTLEHTIDLRIIVDGDLQTADALGVPLKNLYLPDLENYSFVTTVQKSSYDVEIQYAPSGSTKFKTYARYTVKGESGEVVQKSIAEIT